MLSPLFRQCKVIHVCGGLNGQIHAFCRLAMSGEILLLVQPNICIRMAEVEDEGG
jgi:hypothetical protein